MPNTIRLTPYALWRSRLPAQIGTWFARDLTRSALALVEGGRVVLRSVEPARVEATVKDRVAVADRGRVVDRDGSAGPASRLHLRRQRRVRARRRDARGRADRRRGGAAAAAGRRVEPDLSWLPDDRARRRPRPRARRLAGALGRPGGTLTGTLYLDTPRLRGVIRDADAILAMMDQTPADDWDDVDRTLLRDDAVQEAFGSRSSAKALGARAVPARPPPAAALRRRSR